MTSILTWFILSYGLMNIMVFGSIFQGLRNFFQNWGNNKLLPFNGIANFISGILSCPMCFSFHGGWFLSLTVFSPTFVFFGTPLLISWFFDGILSSGAVWAINAIIEWFEENRPTKN
ncbi:MAG: hypothetical protein EBU66_14850 [Bacteroidetes bacterium]|nr:hypothetical protein [bacterium]NBP65926.1 hypothetical protein [Bacteroidota bacterium]